jgi:sec-independent protein translocase protein TatA
VTSGLLSPWHIAILAIVVMVVFGPKRLPEAGRALGRGLREFKDSISGHDDDHPIEPPPTARSLPAPRTREHDTL